MRLPIPAPRTAVSAAGNLVDATVRGGIADRRPMPSALIDEGPLRRVHRYLPVAGRTGAGDPVLLVPPLAAPALCFDLRRGCSVAEHLLLDARRAYLVDYGPVRFSDRSLGLEHWI
jgi:polyhydroxyalkanoate synthase